MVGNWDHLFNVILKLLEQAGVASGRDFQHSGRDFQEMEEVAQLFLPKREEKGEGS